MMEYLKDNALVILALLGLGVLYNQLVELILTIKQGLEQILDSMDFGKEDK